jgi:hypothetical protein
MPDLAGSSAGGDDRSLAGPLRRRSARVDAAAARRPNDPVVPRTRLTGGRSARVLYGRPHGRQMVHRDTETRSHSPQRQRSPRILRRADAGVYGGRIDGVGPGHGAGTPPADRTEPAITTVSALRRGSDVAARGICPSAARTGAAAGRRRGAPAVGGERVRADVDAAFGADVVDEGRRIWRQVLALRDNDDDLLLSLADRWCRLLPAQDPHDVDGRGDGGGDGAVVLDPSGEPASTWSFVTTSHPSWSTVVPCKSARPFAIAVKSCRSAFTVCADGFAVLRCTRNSSNREASRSSSMAPILPGAATFTALPPGVDRPCRAAWNLRLLEAAAPRWTPPTCAACGC